ncbi:hypothetical protein PPERSA_00120 [Pseudocohnilembus persalinus]|uniref:Ubiquinone biosynthesis protein n=1 Tax=Pseudocohnilembus persalinus TaxID=266149 RepID=A0A0V0Q8N2_PSEPJ|nr:hypothetical protein PPERSA_00120 [Pseudocohnilembus persalinus]|eukprot:KRW98523.1 hypothetical protein PPERSA_00120 [Pseudocohnilembus persalinus]
MAVGALPVNAKQTFDLLWNYADDVWFLAGDRSLDYNHYTKRSLFLAAYTSTELHFLTDQSGTYEPTWQFLERRLNDILYFGGKAGQLLNMASASLNGVQQIASLLVPGRKPIRNPEQDINNLKQQQNKQRKEQNQSKYNE